MNAVVKSSVEYSGIWNIWVCVQLVIRPERRRAHVCTHKPKTHRNTLYNSVFALFKVVVKFSKTGLI